MTRIVAIHASVVALLSVACMSNECAAAGGQQAVATAAQNNRFAFVMFYRSNDAATQKMYGILKFELAQRDDATIVPVRIGDAAEEALIKRFDATRLPLPATAVIAPNDAVCTILPQKVSAEQLNAAIVSQAQAECLKGLQDGHLVLLCTQPTPSSQIPGGVQQFRTDKLFRDRTQIVTVHASDPAEAKFLRQLRIPRNSQSPVVAFMAPPGVMVGVFGGNVTHRQLAKKLADAGKCCDDENCKYHHTGGGQQPRR